MTHHRMASIVIAVTAVLDVLGGWWFAASEHLPVTLGLYWAVTTATTVGYGDVTPHSHLGHFIAVLVMLTVVPLFAATFSLFTSGLTSVHVRRAERNLREHITSLKENS